MSSPSLRSGTRSLQRSIRGNPSPRSITGTAQRQRPVHNLASVIATGQIGTRNPARSAPPLHANSPLRTRMTGPSSSSISTSQQLRAYSAPTNSSSTPTADNLIEEIQDLYEIATDEFEIATDSTDGSTIYAASDRESARDALNQLVTVYELYTGSKVASTHADSETQPRSQEGGDGNGEAGVIETNFDPSVVGEDVKGEVRKRVGQRIRELKNAVEILEERAHDE